MAPPVLNSLVFLERQFAAIKKLIPEANQLVVSAHSLNVHARNRFSSISWAWDQLQEPGVQQLINTHFGEEEHAFLSRKLFDLLNLLVQVKRISAEAQQTQKSFKITLFELLSRLYTQVMREGSVMPMPAFNPPPSQIQTSLIGNPKRGRTFLEQKAKGLLGQTINGKSDLEKLEEQLAQKRVPPYFEQIILKPLANLHHLGTTETEEKKRLKELSDQYYQAAKTAQKKGKEFEAQALEIMHKMVWVQSRLNETLEEICQPKYEAWLKEINTALDRYPKRTGKGSWESIQGLPFEEIPQFRNLPKIPEIPSRPNTARKEAETKEDQRTKRLFDLSDLPDIPEIPDAPMATVELPPHLKESKQAPRAKKKKQKSKRKKRRR